MKKIKTIALLFLILICTCNFICPPLKSVKAVLSQNPPNSLTYENVTAYWPTASRVFMSSTTAMYVLSNNTIWKSNDGLSFVNKIIKALQQE